jgi:hypothetical protein
MKSNLKHKKAFLIITYGALIQLLLLPFLEIAMLKPEQIKPYLISKTLIGILIITFIALIHLNKFAEAWVKLFYISCFSFILVGQFFHPGYHFAVIEFMFVCAIIFEGFPLMSLILMLIYIAEYLLFRPVSNYPYYHFIILNALVYSWIISVYLERYVSRVKNKQGILDRKFRYKGIKTDLLMHDLKNQIQPLMYLDSTENRFSEILKTIQSFNSFQEDNEVTFNQVVNHSIHKYEIKGKVEVTGTDDFFIDQMDLQTILCNLMTNSQKAAMAIGRKLELRIKNNILGFTYEDNAGGFTDEQFKFFTQKDITPYPGHEKHGLGILLVKILVEHHGGTFVIQRIPNGTKFEIKY